MFCIRARLLEAAEKKRATYRKSQSRAEFRRKGTASAVPQFVAEIEGFSPWGTLFYLIQLTLNGKKSVPQRQAAFCPVPLRHG
jgi:hypothetical protein